MLTLPQRYALVTATSIAVIGVPLTAKAYDTGHHSDLTREAMADLGFSGHAIQAAQISNWLVDFYSNIKITEADFAKLHFDNLSSTAQIRNYWGWLAINTKKAVEQSAREKDALKLLTLIGASLHAVQDFYTHSNWGEKHPRLSTAPYRSETWFNSSTAGLALITGRYPESRPGTTDIHGDYNKGLNHDSYFRPRWDESYVFGYAGSREWVEAIRSWVTAVDPAFWTTTRGFVASGLTLSHLPLAMTAAYRVSEYAPPNGHWKGPGSGSTAEFVNSSATFVKDQATSPFARQFLVSRTPHLLMPNLSGDATTIPTAPTPPAIPRVTLSKRAVIVRTFSVAEKGDEATFEAKIDPAGRADFVGRIGIAGQTFIECMQLDRSSFSADPTKLQGGWVTMKFVPMNLNPVRIKYELLDEDALLNDLCDINRRSSKWHLDLQFDSSSHALSGDLTGVHDSASTAVTSNGVASDKNRAVVKFWVSERMIAPPPSAPGGGGATPAPSKIFFSPTTIRGVWSSVNFGHRIVPLGGDHVLDWVPATRVYRVWPYDRSRTSGDPLPGPALASGTWVTIGDDHELVNLDGDRVLDWNIVTGAYRIFAYKRGSGGDPLPGPALVRGTWSTIRRVINDVHKLVYLGGDRVLDWKPVTGEYRVWRYDRSMTGTADPLPGPAVTSGKWSSIGPTHEIVNLGKDRILVWERATRSFRVFRFDRTASGTSDPLPNPPLAEGFLSLTDVLPDSELINLEGDRLLAWHPLTGSYRVFTISIP